MSNRYDILGIGNAIVDVLSMVEEEKIVELGLTKGVMTLVDAQRSRFLYEKMDGYERVSGGSVANSAAGAALLGGRAAFTGCVKEDDLGRFFMDDIRKTGTDFLTDARLDGPSTAQSMIFVTPDAQRTMQTYLGACVELNKGDLDADAIEGSTITFLEGYLWDKDASKEALVKAAEICRKAGRMVAFSLSDVFCVERWHSEFTEFVEKHTDILIANEHEAEALFQTSDFGEITRLIQDKVQFAAITQSSQGSMLVSKSTIVHVNAVHPEKLVDTTGAGDLFAAGYLLGISRGWSSEKAGKLGSATATSILSVFGARPRSSLKPIWEDIAGES